MYHIRNDKRAIQSSELIYNGLLECIRKKPFDQITISDLQKASGVARSTFYRAFDNISDVLFWKCDTCFNEVLCNFDPSESGGELELAQHFFSYWMGHSDILVLLIEINRQDIIYACHMKNAKKLEQSFGPLPGLDEINARYFISIRTGITIGVLKAWLDGGRKETTEQLLEIIEKQFRFFSIRFANGGKRNEKDR